MVRQLNDESLAPPRWFDQNFDFSFGEEQFHDILSRLRSAPDQYEAMLTKVPRGLTEYKPGRSWSMKEHTGHLIVLEPLWRKRFQEISNGVPQMSPADLNNAATDAESFNRWSLEELLDGFRKSRAETLVLLQRIGRGSSATSVHPRLGQPMRVVDLMYFVAEHDEHHLVAIGRILKEPSFPDIP